MLKYEQSWEANLRGSTGGHKGEQKDGAWKTGYEKKLNELGLFSLEKKKGFRETLELYFSVWREPTASVGKDCLELIR